MAIELRRLPEENEEQFIWRLGKAKDSGQLDMDWEEIAQVVNEQFRSDDSEYRNESAYRKPYQQAKRYYEAGVFDELTGDKYVAEIREQQIELKKIKQQVSDERTDFQRSIRKEARQESFLDLVKRVMAQSVKSFDYEPSPTIDSDNDMVVCLSDLHTGIEVRNAWNTYDINILQQRLQNYLDEIKGAQATHKCKVCNIVLAGDCISGLIHPNLRLENNENVVEQVKIASVYIGEFIANLRGDFEQIKVHGVSGNHSRLSPNKEDHIKGEELDALILYCISLMFATADNVDICDDGYIDDSINSFRTRGGKLFYVVHGDKDTPASVVSKLTLMTGVKPDAVIMAHRHHNAYDTQYGTKIIQTGSVVGTDNHCIDLRISGEPEQVLFITNEKRAVRCLYDICLNG